MLHFDVCLDKAVADLTRQVRRRFAAQYVGKTFYDGVYAFRVEIEPATFAHFVVDLHINYGDEDEPLDLTAILYKDNDLFGRDRIFKASFDITQHMTVLNAMQCSAHIIGDYIKTAYAVESEN